MKYKDILQFEPITDVIQVDRLEQVDYCKKVVRDFVYPDYFIETILPSMVKNIDFMQSSRKGIQIIGNYGTGKSHLMSLVSLVAEQPELLDLVTNAEAKSILASISGKFKVLRFEMGNQNSLWEIITFQLQRYLQEIGVDYTFEKQSLKMYREQLEDMMAAFEAKYPEQGLMLMIDEMLSYLKGRAATGMLNQDLPVLQALGQACETTRFAFMYGVQEMIYQAPEFQDLASLLLKVRDRYVDMTIRKEDVAFIVHDRLLRKSEQQKQAIRTHLQPFRKLFSGLNSHFDEYVELFPVHPSYFDNFQRIHIGRAQREVLKTLSAQFATIADNDIPNDNPGLITYDTYWEQMMQDRGLQAMPDFKTVYDTVVIVHDKIDANFTEQRARRKPMAKRIVNATAIKILQDQIAKYNGANADVLVEDLCLTDAMAEDKEFLVDMVANCADLIVSATSGQYFEKNDDNGEYHLRTEGGINVDQIIKQQAETMSLAQKDAAYFAFLVEALNIELNPYRTGFRIYQHELTWASHKVARDGYIFFGNSAEKSTTHPKQYFYMMFMPIFQPMQRNNEDDEIYFDMNALNDDFRSLVCLHGAASNMVGASDSSQKVLYQQKKDDLFRKTRRCFDEQYLKSTQVIYRNEQKTLLSYSLPGQGCTKMEVFDSVASEMMEQNFCTQTPHYPEFKLANQPITHENLPRYIKNVYTKLQQPTLNNQDGQAILSALGLYTNGAIDANDSIYAQSILKMMSERDENVVVNRDEILEVLPNSNELIWRSRDYQIDAQFEFVVLCTMAYLGECEVVLNNNTILNASNLHVLNTIQPEDCYCFSCIKRPKGLNLPVIKAITLGLCGKDYSNQLDKESTYTDLVNTAKQLAQRAAQLSATTLQHPISVGSVEILSQVQVDELRQKVDLLKGFCDKMTTYTSAAKLKNLPYSVDDIRKRIDAKKHMEQFDAQLKLARELEHEVNYLNQAQQYVEVSTQLYQQIADAIQKLPSILTNPAEQIVKTYQDELKAAKAAYIEYYMRLYSSYCITEIDEQKRLAILQSAEYTTTSILADCPILNAAQWTTWRSQFMQLRPANPAARTMLETSPYVSPFNPLNNNTALPSLMDMETQIKDIYASYIQQLKEYVAGNDAQEALALTDDPTRNFANSFLNGLYEVQTEQQAKTIVEFINTISGGFVRAEVTADGLAKYINRPMTIEEAKGAFANYLQRLTAGQPSSKVRIIFKSI